MFYIVRIYAAGCCVQEIQYTRLEEARAHMRSTEYHAKLYVWLNGREDFMESVN